MSLRILVAPARLREGEVELGDADHHYLSRVRRAATGDAITAFDGAGRAATGTIAAIEPDRTVLRLGPVAEVAAPPPHVTCLLPLIKGERLTLCLEKLVEVGVDAIVLYRAERAVVRLEGERAGSRRDRLAGVLRAAARQCGRAAVPTLDGPVPLPDALAAAAPAEVRWLAIAGADPPSVTHRPGAIAILSGPEGGLSASELGAAGGAGFVPVGLGPYVLRAETAPIVAVAHARILNYG